MSSAARWSTGRSTGLATPRSPGMPGGEAYYYVRRLPGDRVPAGEEQFHRRVWLHRLGTDPERDALVFGEGLDETNYYGVRVSRDGRWLTVSAAAGTAPRNDLWLADLATCRPGCSGAPSGVGGDRRPNGDRGRPRRPALRLHRSGRAAWPAVHLATRSSPTYEHLDRSRARGSRRRCSRATRSSTGRPGPAGTPAPPGRLDAACGQSRSRSTTWDDGARLGTVDLPGLGSIGGLVERPEGGHEAWFGYTDHTHAVIGLPLRRRDTARSRLWASPPGSVDVPAVRTQQLTYTSYDGTTGADVRHVRDRGRAAPARARPSCTATAASACSLTPAYSASMLAWVEAGGVYAVANLRGGREEGEQWHRAGMRERKQNVLRRLPRRGRGAGRHGWTDAGAARRSRAARTAGCWSALPSPSGPSCTPRSSAPHRCSTWCGTSASGSGVPGTTSTAPRTMPRELGWLLSYSPYHHVCDGTPYPAVLFTVFDGDTPSRPDARPEDVRGAAARHDERTARYCCVARPTSVTVPARSAARSTCRSTPWRSSPTGPG